MASVEQTRRISEPPGRSSSLEELYELHAPALRRRCERLTRDPHAAEDLMQEVFVRFLARFPEAPADMHVAGYLHATARNILWKQLRDDHEVADGDIERSAGSDDDLEIDPERSALLDEQQSLVRRCSAALTGRQRRALTLREVEGRSYAEIGSDLGIGSDAVAQVISRARVRLRVAVRRAHVDLDQLAPECRALLGPLSDYLDGHAAKHTAEIEAHLAECGSCRDTLATFQGAGSRLRGALPLTPLAGILARIGEAVRFGGGAPADAVRAGAVAVAAAVAIGGGGTYAAHALTVAAGPRAVLQRTAAAHRPLTSAVAPSLAAAAVSGTAAPAAVQGRREQGGGSRRTAGGRRPRPDRRATTRPGVAPTSAAPAATPISAAPSTPSAPPAGTPSATPAAGGPTTKTRPAASGAGNAPSVSPPAVRPVDPSAPVKRTVARVSAPVAKNVVAPVVTTVVDPVVDQAVATVVSNVVAPVTKAVAPATASVTKAVEPVTTPIVGGVAPVTDPLVKAVAPMLPGTPSPATPATPATSPPAEPTPSLTTPSVTTPGVTVPPMKLSAP